VLTDFFDPCRLRTQLGQLGQTSRSQRRVAPVRRVPLTVRSTASVPGRNNPLHKCVPACGRNRLLICPYGFYSALLSQPHALSAYWGCSCRKETPRDVTAQFKENGDSKAPITPVSQPVQPAAPTQGKGKAVMKAIDGNEATANIAYAFNDVSFIYPITPATPMGEAVDQWSNEGRINLHNNVMEVSITWPAAAAAISTEGALCPCTVSLQGCQHCMTSVTLARLQLGMAGSSHPAQS